MNLSGFENVKNLADGIQENTDGTPVTNSLGTENINVPMDNEIITDFNRGVDTMSNMGNHHALPEGITSDARRWLAKKIAPKEEPQKPHKEGSYRPPQRPDDPIPGYEDVAPGTAKRTAELNKAFDWEPSIQQRREIENFESYSKKDGGSFEDMFNVMYKEQLDKKGSSHPSQLIETIYDGNFVKYLEENKPEHYKYYNTVIKPKFIG